MYHVCSFRVMFNVGVSLSEMRRLYSIKFKKTNAHTQRKDEEELERVNERTLKIPGAF